MSTVTSKKRSIRLTPEASAILRNALNRRWTDQCAAKRLTRDLRGELLGISGVTADRLLAAKQVDRATAHIAFMEVGVVWSDSFEAKECAEPQELETVDARPTPRRTYLWSPGLAVLALPAIAILIAAGILRWPRGQHASLAPPLSYACNTLLVQGTDLYNEGDYKHASRLIEATMAFARSQGLTGDLACTLLMSGNLAAERGSLREARDDYMNALAIRKSLRQEECVPPLLELIGDVETKMGDYQSASDDLRASLLGFEKCPDLTGVSLAKRDLGSLAYERHDLNAAAMWLSQSLDAIRGVGKPEIEADVRSRQALVLSKQGRAAQAKAMLQECLAFWSDRKHPRWIALTQYELGQVEMTLGERDSARRLATSSYQAYLQVGDAFGAAHARSLLTAFSSQAGNDGLAPLLVSTS